MDADTATRSARGADDGVVVGRVDGRRSASALGREVVAAALAVTDPAAADATRRDPAWRTGYPAAFRALGVAARDHDDASAATARAGLAALHAHLRWHPPSDPADADDRPLDVALDAASDGARTPGTARVRGTGERADRLRVPYRGALLADDDLRRRLDTWVADGVVEPGAADAVRAVVDHPAWLDARDLDVTLLGATAETGPLRPLLAWGATVRAVARPRPDAWAGLADVARASAGTLLAPVAVTGPDARDADITRAGLDVLRDPGAVAAWLLDTDPAGPAAGPHPAAVPVLGDHLYGDGATNVRLAGAADLVRERVRAQRPGTALAWLATPTDVFTVPREVVDAGAARYAGRGAGLRRAVAAATRGRLLAPADPALAAPVAGAGQVDVAGSAAPGTGTDAAGPALVDAVVPQQGPSYLLAKRVHRWRATAARADGALVSLHVAPPTRTRSVVKNPALAAAYAGAGRFGIEVVEPGTTRALMAALLLHDLRTGGTPAGTPAWRAETERACHGGLWRTGYDPRSVLTVAAALGAPTLLRRR